MNTQEDFDIAPTPEFLLSEMNRDIQWSPAIAETIDNSFDAKANRVRISILRSAKRVMVEDNGIGCESPQSMFRMGKTDKAGKMGVLGRYGVGLKNASMYLCGEHGRTCVTTTFGGVCRQAVAVWRNVIDRNWKIDAPVVVAEQSARVLIPDGTGTRIEFERVCKQFLTKPQLDEMLKEWSFTFSPALRAGKQIEVVTDVGKSRLLVAPADPQWTDHVAFDVAIGTRTAKVRFGIKADDDKSGRMGMSYCFGHRVITADTADGCGDYPIGQVAGFVELDHRWALGANKGQVTDDQRHELHAAILERIRPLLEKAKNTARTLQTQALAGSVSAMLNNCIAAVVRGQRAGGTRPKGKPREEGTSGPSGPHGLKSRKGSSRGRLRGPSVVIEAVDEPANPRGIWVSDSSDSAVNRVMFNRAVPMVAKAWASLDEQWIASMAMAVVLQKGVAKSETMFKPSEFWDQLSAFMRNPFTMGTATAQSA